MRVQEAVDDAMVDGAVCCEIPIAVVDLAVGRAVSRGIVDEEDSRTTVAGHCCFAVARGACGDKADVGKVVDVEAGAEFDWVSKNDSVHV